MGRFDIAKDVESASTLPGRFYTDAAVHADLVEKVFARSWQFVGDTDELKVPGQAVPHTILEGCLDEPVLFTRDMDDQLHCMSNVCTHRANLVCEGTCNVRHLRCRYHGRRFGLDGRFQSMPEFEDVVGFPSQSDDLPRVPFGVWHKWLFACVAPEHSLESVLGEVDERVGFLPLDEYVHAPERARDYLVNAHWALYVDNYLEGFHIPYIHSALNATLDYGQYRTVLLEHGNLQLGAAAGGEEAFVLPDGHPEAGQRIGAFYFWIYPNLMLNFYPWGLSVNVVKPLSHCQTKVSFIPFVYDSSKLGSGSGAALDRVEREDEAVVEMVQKGLRSRFYKAGRFSPTRENGVHQFHTMLSRSLSS